MEGKWIRSPVALAALLMLAVIADGCIGAPTATPLQTAMPSPQFNCGALVALLDPDGLVAACDARIDSGMDSHEGLDVTTTQVIAQWMGAMCWPDQRAIVERAGSTIVLSITAESPPRASNAPSCAGGVLPVALTITFRSPIDGDVQATVNGEQVLPLGSPQPSSSADAARTTCSGIIGNVPMVNVRSGAPTVAAADEVTGEQMTNYFVVELAHGAMSNGADWWDSPTKMVDMCVFDGDFETQTPGPPGHDTNATRVLVVVDGSEAFPWAFCFRSQTSCGIPTTNPATISARPPDTTTFEPTQSTAPSPIAPQISPCSFVPGQLSVKFTSQLSDRSEQDAFAAANGLREISRAPNIGWIRYQITDGKSQLDKAAELLANSMIANAIPILVCPVDY